MKTSSPSTYPRRRFLTLTALAGVTAAVCAARGAEAAPGIVDTHTHFYDPSRPQGVPWPPATDSLLHRTVLPEHYRPLAAEGGIVGTIVVEASPWIEDNQWLLDLAKDEPLILGIVGRLDPLDAEFPALLARFSKHPLFRGIRFGGGTLKAHASQPAMLDSLRRLAAADLSLDLNGGPDFLPAVAQAAEAAPALRIVIDHCGGPGDPAHASLDAWRRGIELAAAWPNVFCKVSGLPEQTKAAPGKAPREAAYYRPILDAVWDAFGEDRVLFGSNWPVSERGAPFPEVLRLVREFFVAKGAAAVRKYFAENARAVYRWPAR
jgi:predicted TIM-barrel fold metal-dependent hydrolase